MRFLLSVSFALLLSEAASSQSSCKRSSPLFHFDPHVRPRNFTEKLGNHPQFAFLQRENGIVSRALFLRAVQDPTTRVNYKAAFDVFDRLLKDIGFTHGYKDLRPDNIERDYINPGTIGNLGYFNQESNYVYVKLNPAGEGDDGVAAWKITGPQGCSFYVLHTCGNAFFAIDPSGCACSVAKTVSTVTDTVRIGCPKDSPVVKKSDTVYLRQPGKGQETCRMKWEIAADGGISFNSAPRLNSPAQHTQTDGAHPLVALSISRIFSHWLQAGVSAAVVTLGYQDDIAYPGAVPNPYNTVYPGSPMIPVQLFGKATIGGPIGWQATVSLSAGYSFAGGSKIVSGGNTLAAKPGTKGGPTAGWGMGLAYFFNCRWGLALAASGQYFDNKATTMTYHIITLPVSAGVRYRF